jgi:hypothetical protein
MHLKELSNNKYLVFLIIFVSDLFYCVVCIGLNQYVCNYFLTIFLVILICGHFELKRWLIMRYRNEKPQIGGLKRRLK